LTVETIWLQGLDVLFFIRRTDRVAVDPADEAARGKRAGGDGPPAPRG
jgi:hypothetical protein